MLNILKGVLWMKSSLKPKDLVDFRKNTELSQADLAELLGITLQGVRLWEDGKRDIPETTARLIRLFKKYPQLVKEFLKYAS